MGGGSHSPADLDSPSQVSSGSGPTLPRLTTLTHIKPNVWSHGLDSDQESLIQDGSRTGEGSKRSSGLCP